MEFNNKKHADDLLEAECLICYAQMAAEGLQPASNQMGEKQFKNCAAGVFGLLSYVLDKVHWALDEAETEFRLSHGLEYGEGGAHE